MLTNNFPAGCSKYYSRIFDKYDKDITAFAIFTDSDRRFHPQKFERTFLGTQLSYAYNTCKILEQSEVDLHESQNPFAMVALTVKLALDGQRMEERQLYDLKLDLAKRLLLKKMPKKKIRVLMNFLRYYIRFENREMANTFDEELATATQKNTTMGIEEFLLDRARKEGEKRGEKQGFTVTAENLLRKGMSVQEVSSLTTLSIEEVARIAQKIQAK